MMMSVLQEIKGRIILHYTFQEEVQFHAKFQEDEEESVKIMFYLYFIPGAFLHVLHLDVLKRQTEIETESEKFLMYGYNAGPPMAIPILYTVYYRTV